MRTLTKLKNYTQTVVMEYANLLKLVKTEWLCKLIHTSTSIEKRLESTSQGFYLIFLCSFVSNR